MTSVAIMFQLSTMACAIVLALLLSSIASFIGVGASRRQKFLDRTILFYIAVMSGAYLSSAAAGWV